jgi:hypothetical protein
VDAAGDPHWFGARIPGQVKSVEFLSVAPGQESYQKYEGSPLTRTITSTGHPEGSRAEYLLSMRAAVMP